MDNIDKIRQLQAQAVKDKEKFGKIRNDFNAKHTASQEAEDLTQQLVDNAILGIMNGMSPLEQENILHYSDWQHDGLWRIYGIADAGNKVFNDEDNTLTDYDKDTDAMKELDSSTLDYLMDSISSRADFNNIDSVVKTIADLKEWIASIEVKLISQSELDEKLAKD